MSGDSPAKTGATLREVETLLVDLGYRTQFDYPDEQPRIAKALAAVRARIAADDTIGCAFCAFKAARGPRDRETMAEHVAECAAHPMRAALVEIERLRAGVEESRDRLAEAFAGPRDGLESAVLAEKHLLDLLLDPAKAEAMLASYEGGGSR